jgi:hypothetical protein
MVTRMRQRGSGGLPFARGDQVLFFRLAENDYRKLFRQPRLSPCSTLLPTLEAIGGLWAVGLSESRLEACDFDRGLIQLQ